MIEFLLKGIMRDKNRSQLPIIIVAIGVMLTVMLSGYIRGAMGDMIDLNARFETGHVKVMSQAYFDNASQLPNDLALLDAHKTVEHLKTDYSSITWVERIKFGGLLDVPDENGETVGQGPGAGMALDLLHQESGEIDRMNIESALVEGTVPQQPGHAIIGYDFATRLNLKPGDDITFFGSTMNGSMTFKNFKVAGLIKFGTPSMDRGAFIVDISDAREMLDMDDAVGEILGFLPNETYVDEEAKALTASFNEKYMDKADEYSPVMVPLSGQAGLGSYLEYVDVFSFLFVGIFVFAMSIVLWNTGLLGGLRRYKEFGIRLALGESKGKIYRSLLAEALLIGFIGSFIGTLIGLGVTYYMQVVGIDISDMLANITMMMPSVLRSKFSPELLYIGFIPGVLAMVVGNMLSGIGIYQRETAQLFKELEV
ncbi:FtsX-like permease family protein [Flammeovirgaceae bacterium SG7u.111]|nr:FtsX-like permease family protein [Flammeovirgaceae bacterium SG7u.132]WPO38119.1 FtsX-like permease family protein [Flammeovirgaceae bacterium SG7u.111]